MSKQSKQNSKVIFVLGGARSGKSKFAEELVLKMGLKPIYLATGRAYDDEMEERIALHKERRNSTSGVNWETIEEPLALSDALMQTDFEGRAILVDCLTLWVTNLMMAGADIEVECEQLANTLLKMKAPVVLVSNEVGLSIIPENKMAREFRDYAGSVNQQIAKIANQAYFIAAGLPLKLK
ncbi:MAG: bifunctional adenosylcobinamide kinase/adenosylcobinamide-phosphate guanylyltransferase [Rhizobiales bacterium]|nr:bifunctional adenosylcobinamide kinase/adenosylcobinamide-phosphate guanylyltransferase [Hyphomicrobiales bacterium]